MRFLLVFCCLLNGIPFLLAQNKDSLAFDFPNRQLKVSLLDMIDPFAPAFMLSYEQGFSKDFSLLMEGGPVSSFDGHWVMQDPIEGYKLRGELRYYLALDDQLTRFYLGLQAMYRRTVKPNLTGTFCRYDCSFFQEMDYRFIKNVTAGHFSLGITAAVSKHIVLDFGGFAGFRYLNKVYDGIPSDAVLLREDFITIDFDTPGESLIPSIGAAFRVGFGW